MNLISKNLKIKLGDKNQFSLLIRNSKKILDEHNKLKNK